MSELVKEKFCKPTYERALIAYCFDSVANYFIIAANVSVKDFLRPEHRLIWTILGTLVKRGVTAFDGALIIDEAKKNGVLKDVGGYEYIHGIIGMDIADENIHYYVDKVLNASTKYQLFMQLEVDMKQVGDGCENEDVTAADLIGKVTNDVLDLSLKSKAIKEAKNTADGIEEYIEERRAHPIEFCGLSTGFPILDKRIDGLVPGTLAVICARPKNGKSTFLSNVSAHVAFKVGKPVLYVDTEMTFNEWRSRIISMMSGVHERKIKHGGYSDQEYHNIQQAIKLIKGGKLFHEYMPGYSIDKLAALYKKYKHIEGIELGIFDYIKAPPGVDFSNKKEHQLLGDVTTVLHDLAGELQIPFFCANQINRQDDIADSDRILRYADVLMFFKRKELDEINNAGISSGTYRLIIKNSRRGGETPSEGIGYDFFKSTLQISEAPVQQIDYSGKEYSEAEDIEYGRETNTDKSTEEINESDF